MQQGLYCQRTIFCRYIFDDNNGCPIIRDMSDKITIRGGGCTTEDIQYDGRILFKPYDDIITMEIKNFSIKEESSLCLEHFNYHLYGGLVFNEESTEAYEMVRKDMVQYDKGCKKTEQSYWYQSNLYIEPDDMDGDSWNGTYNGTGTVLQVSDKVELLILSPLIRELKRIFVDLSPFREAISSRN